MKPNKIRFLLGGGIALLVIAVAVAGLGLFGQAEVLQPTPTIQDLPAAWPDLVRPADPAVAQAVLEANNTYLRTPAIRENSGVAYADFPVISAGELLTFTVPLSNSIVTVDALYAYLAAKTGVHEIPVVIGYQSPTGYTFFDASQPLDATITRSEALEMVKETLPRGAPFSISTFKYVSINGVDWQTCAATETVERVRSGCNLALAYNQGFSNNEERMFLSKIVISPRWVPVGWWFIGSDSDQIIALPEE